MKVLKFGGTSVGSAQRMKEVAKLITDGEQFGYFLQDRKSTRLNSSHVT